MKLTIDTKEDSHDEIRKAIRMLSTIVGDEHLYTNSPKQHNTNIFDSGSSTIEPSSSEQSKGSLFGNIFGDASSSPSQSQQSAGDSEEKKEDEEKPHIIVEY